ncbi:MAG: acyltransferase family protein [Gammaproteobacteria bacterium]|nr:acyltransferase family protein [Gammaproteobacteria bacterium]
MQFDLNPSGCKTSISPYRPELDGLRALAVISVIINHFNKDLLPSGYLGVDIFFVISGYVISLSLVNQLTKGFNDFILDFYTKRIKRLLPALVFCVVLTGFMIWLINPTPGTSLTTGICALFGISNLYLLSQANDYFAASSEVNVFTQTWSLGVEEQFYLLFPFILWFTGLRRLSSGLRNIYWVISILSLRSLVAFIFLSGANQPAAFFLMPTRFWELGAGCLLFLVLQNKNAFFLNNLRILDNIKAYTKKRLSVIFCAIIAVFFVPLQFSVYATITVVLLTMLLIAFAQPRTPVYAFLTARQIVYIGRISYSLYLWHWSVLSISRWTVGIHWWTAPFQIALMLLFSVISYQFIENPLRRAQWSSINLLSIGYGLSASLISALICFVLLSQHNPKTLIFYKLTAPIFLPIKHSGLRFDLNCVVDGITKFLTTNMFDKCTVLPREKNGNMIWALGDSHAGHLQGLLYSLHDQTGLGIHLIEMPGHSFPLSRDATFSASDIVFEEIKNRLHSGDIVLLSRLFLDRSDKRKVKDLSTWIDDVVQLAQILSSKGVRVVIVGPPPMFTFEHINTCITSWWGNDACDIDRASISPAIQEVYDLLEKGATLQSNIYIFNQFDILCPENSVKCSPFKNGKFLFRDKDHLNSLGSAGLTEHFIAWGQRRHLLS